MCSPQQSSRLLSLSPSALVPSFAALLPSDSSHRPPPAVRTRTSPPPPSSLQPPPHPDRCSSPALVTMSVHRRHCRRDPLVAPTALVAPSAARSRHAIRLPAQRRFPRSCPMTSQCSCCEMLMTTSLLLLASFAFALHCRPLAERHFCVRSHIAPEAHCCCCCGCCRCLRVVVVIAATKWQNSSKSCSLSKNALKPVTFQISPLDFFKIGWPLCQVSYGSF